MGVVFIVFLGVCGIILSGGLVNWVNIYLGKQTMGKKQTEALQIRLDEMERRLADIQEVVLAIDEKLEYLDIKKVNE